jgi:hypothetical protein
MAISFVGSLPTVAVANGGNVTLTFSNLRDAAGVQPTLAQNDVIVAVFAWGNTADYTAPTITGWALLDDKYANGSTNDTNLAVYYKKMTASPDTAVTATGPGGAANSSIGVAFAFRGVDTTTAIDTYVSGTHSTTGTGTGAINPLAITPATAGAWIAVVGALANPIGANLSNGGDLSATTNHFRTGTSPDTTDISVGFGIKTDWVSGPFDPAAWSGGGTRAAGDSWAAITFAIKAQPAAQSLTPSLFTNADTLYAPTVTTGAVAITPGLFTNSQTFHAPIVAPGAVVLTPSLFTDSQTFHAATVASLYTITPNLFSDSQSFFAATVATGAVALEPLLLTNTQTFGTHTLSATYSLTSSLFTNTNDFYAHVIEADTGLDLQPGLHTNAQSFFDPTLSTTYSVTPSLFTNDQDFPPVTVTPGAVTLAPTLVTNSQSFFTAVVGTSYSLVVPLVIDADTFFSPTVSVGSVDVVPPLVANDNQFFSPTVIVAGGTQALEPGLYTNVIVFPFPSVRHNLPAPVSRTTRAEPAVRVFAVGDTGNGTLAPRMPRTSYAQKRTA